MQTLLAQNTTLSTSAVGPLVGRQELRAERADGVDICQTGFVNREVRQVGRLRVGSGDTRRAVGRVVECTDDFVAGRPVGDDPDSLRGIACGHLVEIVGNRPERVVVGALGLAGDDDAPLVIQDSDVETAVVDAVVRLDAHAGMGRVGDELVPEATAHGFDEHDVEIRLAEVARTVAVDDALAVGNLECLAALRRERVDRLWVLSILDDQAVRNQVRGALVVEPGVGDQVVHIVPDDVELVLAIVAVGTHVVQQLHERDL